MKRTTFAHALGLAIVTLAAAKSEVLHAEDASSALARAAEQRMGSLAGKTTYVMTDKPLYHPGEAVWFRLWELQTRTLKGGEGQHGITAKLLDARGGQVAEKRLLVQGGMATNDFELNENLAGGTYTLRFTSDAGGTFEKTIVVSTYELPRVKKGIEFTRKSYGPGDEVTVILDIKGATGESMMGAKVTAVITVDGAQIARFFVPIDNKGKGVVAFQLPPHITKGDGLLTLQVDAGGVTEATQRRIPIVLNEVSIAAYPEGGDLVTGLPSRVYLQGNDVTGKPAEIEGDLVDDKGRVMAHYKSLHAGKARLSFTPEAGRSYSLKVQKPAGITQVFNLPVAQPSGCVLASKDDYKSGDRILTMHVRCTGERKVTATASLREVMLATAEVTVKPGVSSDLALPLANDTRGAVRVTLFDTGTWAPLAERLVYRGLGKEVKVAVTADKPSYAPRDKVTLTVQTTDDKGHPTPADLALAVVDDTVLSYADDKSGRILAGIYLEHEMPGQKVFEPNFYFSSDAKAPEAMDLLLGTQGYRRFDWQLVKPAEAQVAQ